VVIAYWIVAGLAALVFLAAGLMKLAQPKEKLKASLPWTEDFSATAIKLIGLAEVLGAIGLIVPMLTGILPILSPIAGIALAVLMIGAAITHIRRKEPPIPFALAVLAAAAAVLGFLVLAG